MPILSKNSNIPPASDLLALLYTAATSRSSRLQRTHSTQHSASALSPRRTHPPLTGRPVESRRPCTGTGDQLTQQTLTSYNVRIWKLHLPVINARTTPAAHDNAVQSTQRYYVTTSLWSDVNRRWNNEHLIERCQPGL